MRTGDRRAATQVLDELRSRRQADRRHPRESRRRRARLADRDAGDPDRARQGLPDVHRRERVAAAARVPLLRRSPAWSARRPTTSTSARSCSSTAATSSATPPRRSGGRALASSTSTTTTTTRCSARSTRRCPEASCTAEIVWDLMRGLGVTPTLDDRRGAVRRADHRHRAVHVREHRSARARDGRRADRGRRRRPRDLPARVRGRPVRQARAARPRAREGPPLRRRPADGDRARRGRLRRVRRRGELLRRA